MTKSAKRALGLLLIVSAIFSMSGCDFGSKRISDIEQYGQFESYIELPEFFPDSVDGYTVNAYAYHLESWMDTCYEILLDITVAESQFEELLSGVLEQGKECYYSEGFYEVIFEDHYDIFTEEEDSQQVVGYADIEKIIYNPETNRIVYVALHANDTGVYPLKDVAYFNCFHIDEKEYVKHIEYGAEN